MAAINRTVGVATILAGGTAGSSMVAPDKKVELELENEGEGEDEEEEEEEKEENQGENVDTSDNGHWEDLPSSHTLTRKRTSTWKDRAENNQFGLLFRSCGPKTGQVEAGEHPNIDYDILNTKDSVIPRRFARRHVRPGEKRGHSGLLSMPPQRLIRMLQHHTRGLVDGRSEISSWTHSLIAAVSFAQQIFHRDGKAAIHIIDTTQIENDIIHNADIRRAFGNTDSITTLFPTEWIVHGVVDGPGHWLVKFRKIKSDLPSLRLKPAHSNGFPHMGFSERQAINSAMNAGRVKHDPASLSVTCSRVAATMMERYKAPDTPRANMIQLRLQGMLYCLCPRCSRKILKAGLDETDHYAIIKAVGDLTAAPEPQKCLDIMEDDVFTHKDFPDVTQARLFLRLLATSREAARQVEEVSRQTLKGKQNEFEDEENRTGAWDKVRESKTGYGHGIPGLDYLSFPGRIRLRPYLAQLLASR